MAGFVKLDAGILNSTLWLDRDAREVFITALLMAEPREVTEPLAQIEVSSLDLTGWEVPPGWYGFVPAASVGIVHRAGLEQAKGMEAIKRLGAPEPESRSADHGGRRMVRVDGGFIILNFIKYRDRDYTAKERVKRWRDRQKEKRTTDDGTRNETTVTRNITQAEVRDQKQKQRSEADPNSRGAAGPEGKPDPTWGAGVWMGHFKRAWEAKYSGRFYGNRLDGTACGDLSDLLARMPPEARVAAQERAEAMISEFLADESPKVVKAGHPFTFFVTAFGSLGLGNKPATGRTPRDGGVAAFPAQHGES